MMAPIIVFGSSLGCIIAFFFFKQWEWSRGAIVFPRLRFKLDMAVLRFLRTSKEKAPRISKEFSSTMADHANRLGKLALLSIIRRIERRLQRIRNFINGKMEIRNNGSASFYLKDVAEHKKRIASRRARIVEQTKI
jgi:hypothetical protein